MKKYLYLLTQDVENGYDTYDSVIVCAENEDIAKTIQPNGTIGFEPISYNWASDFTQVTATLIGVADESVSLNSVVLASFNAG